MLANKRIVVLAGSSGIGAQVALQASEKGAAVTITGRDPTRLAAAASAMPAGVATAAFDATDRDQVCRFFEEYGRIDHLVSCVGMTGVGTLLEEEETSARATIENKLWVQLFIVRTAYPSMAPDGSIVLTGGTSQNRSIFPHFAAFSIVGNAALGALVQGLAGEIAPVRINVVEPNLTDTPLLDALSPGAKADLFARFSAKTPIGRVPHPQEVARSYIHAMESGLINGDRLRPDGGPTFSGW